MAIYKDGKQVDIDAIIDVSDGVVDNVVDAAVIICLAAGNSNDAADWLEYYDDEDHNFEGELSIEPFQLGNKFINGKKIYGRPDCTGLLWMTLQLMGYYAGANTTQFANHRDIGVNIITDDYNPRQWNNNADDDKNGGGWANTLPLSENSWEIITPKNGQYLQYNELQFGDLIDKKTSGNYHGHGQIFGTYQNGHLYVFNWGTSGAIRNTLAACRDIRNGKDPIQALIDNHCTMSIDDDESSPTASYTVAYRFKGFLDEDVNEKHWKLPDDEGTAKGIVLPDTPSEPEDDPGPTPETIYPIGTITLIPKAETTQVGMNWNDNNFTEQSNITIVSDAEFKDYMWSISRVTANESASMTSGNIGYIRGYNESTNLDDVYQSYNYSRTGSSCTRTRIKLMYVNGYQLTYNSCDFFKGGSSYTSGELGVYYVETLIIENVETIPGRSFCGINVGRIIIGSGVKTVESEAFKIHGTVVCPIVNVNISNTVENVASKAFGGTYRRVYHMETNTPQEIAALIKNYA